jgi:outer membrane protein insertion porin family
MRRSRRTTSSGPASASRWRLQTSSANQAYQIAYTNPYHTVDGISRGFNLSYRATDFDELDTADYKIDTGIIGVNYGIPLSESNRFNFGFDLRQIDFETGGALSGGTGLRVGRGQ